MKNIRVHLTVVNVKRFICANKKAIISCVIVFLVGIILGICITIAGCQGEFQKVNTNDIIYSSFKVFFLFSLAELLGYFVLLFSIVNFFLTLCSMCVLIYLGYVFGKYACMLVACYSINGITNLIFIYIPVFLVAFILMTVALVKVLEFGACNECNCKTLADKSKTSCNCYSPQRNQGFSQQTYNPFQTQSQYSQGKSQYSQNKNCYSQYQYRSPYSRNQQYQSSGYRKGGEFGSQRKSGTSKSVFSNLKPSVTFTLMMFAINVGLNFVIFIILGLIFPVIVV